MTPEQIELARHALGLPNERSKAYRNHFVCGPGHSDYDNWVAMTDAGLAKSRKGTPLSGGEPVFWLTLKTATSVLAKGECLDMANFPEERS